MAEREKFITATQLADHLGVRPKTILNKTQLGQIPHHHLPGSSRPRYLLSEVINEMSTSRRHRSKARRSRALKAVG